jgi:phosphatidylserine decarboxylase
MGSMKPSGLWAIRHQYIERHDGRVRTERLCGDALVSFLYARMWEDAPALHRLLTGARVSRVLGFLKYDTLLGGGARGVRAYLEGVGVDLTECVEAPARLDTARKLFERRIRYWECRPMPADPRSAVSPADARVLVGSLRESSAVFLKGKFFDLTELLGADRRGWLERFADADWAVLRLTPDKYHYNHVPAAGRVVDLYCVPGRYHSCNPAAVVTVMTPYSKNRRTVTILDTDVPEGSRIGAVAMIEIAALMVGDVVQCYCEEQYRDPRPAAIGMSLRRGAPKSLFRPGGSTVVLLFERGRIAFAPDLVANRFRFDAESRFSLGFGRSLVETDLRVRSLLAAPATPQTAGPPRTALEEVHDGQ